MKPVSEKQLKNESEPYKKNSLRNWIYRRLFSLVLGSIVVIAFCMWLRYFVTNTWVSYEMPEAVRTEFSMLQKNPENNPGRYHEIIDRWYGIDYSDPSIATSDWLLLFVLVLLTAPVLFFIMLRSVRPVSVHISRLASVARAVTKGNFGVSTAVPTELPDELKRLSEDINTMSGQLSRYEKDLKAWNVALAHELRSPLTASIGRLQGMLDGVFEASPSQLNMVMKQLQNLNCLVDDLHLLSLADAGQLHLNRTVCNISELVREKIAWVKPRLIESGINVTLLSQSDVQCHADPFRLGQVLLILLDNAIRYAADGKTIEIEYGLKDDHLTITCSDRGMGVSDEFMQTIFVRFSRADASRARHSGGSGLGLSIAAAICKAHGGRLNAHRNHYGGMTFVVTLPCNPTEDKSCS
ncbi:BaeS [Tatumella morbirosei]|uniref:histidine kinase n=1 Tax=Tatumella morbirosei TaxID=642227 RepID=A0A0F5BUQ2_9GAMM|nr:ATP-binding protein [Tatumella morbirosei]KKA63582.1 BaeS [Tatumella morbirosei]